MASKTIGRALMVSALTLAGAGCGGSDESTEPAEEPAAATATTDAPDVASTQPAATAPPATASPETAPAETASVETAPPAETTPVGSTPATTDPVTSVPAPSGAGIAVVDVGGDRYEFRVTQCLRDRPSAFGDTTIDMTLDGVPVDTPQELIDPLIGEIDPDIDLFPLVEPVAAYGPLLSVSRFDGGGDYVVVYDLDVVEITSDPDPLSPDSRFLDVPDGEAGITISGATTADGAPLMVSATCP